LEGGDGTVGVGEAGLEMSEDLCSGGPTCVRGRDLGRRTATQERGADGGLAVVESLPDALPGSVASRALGGFDGGDDGADDGELEERPEGVCGDVQASDLVGEPDAEGSPTAGPLTPLVAIDPPRTDGGSLRVAVVESGENAVAIECTDGVAVRAVIGLEPLDDVEPLLLVAVEAW